MSSIELENGAVEVFTLGPDTCVRIRPQGSKCVTGQLCAYLEPGEARQLRRFLDDAIETTENLLKEREHTNDH